MGEQSFQAAVPRSHAAALLRTGLNPCPQRTEPRAPSLPSHGRMIAIPTVGLLGVPSSPSDHGGLFFSMSASVNLSLSPELVVCARCSCVMLSPGFLIPSPLHCPFPGVRVPSEARGCRSLTWRWPLHAVFLALAWLRAGWWRCCKRASECVCEVEVCASLQDLPSNPASCAFPSQQGTWLCFFSLLPCVFFCFLSCSPSLFPALSLFLCFFLFCFSSRKSKRGKGKGQKRKRKKGRYKPPSLYVCVLCL